ncbi:ultraviolet-B receptor UVR8-like isoform X2 [Vitis riparia]|uniref:ultraviolet-B receptor UVR8-like isoform X2 n=1 Tax=Vitis riparia TaxID=96939 RepID=UPI00155B186C|nr:ultraviolet-B receptor UVR8-like isoform X2 [Vitis riparia]
MKMEESVVYMWGYLPGASPQGSPLLSPVPVALPASTLSEESWKDVCGGGCGFAVAISESGKLITWGSEDDLGQSYLTSGQHGETPEPFPLPTEAPIVKAAAGWAHCVSLTDKGEAYTWGWKECVPSGKVLLDSTGVRFEKDSFGKQSLLQTEQEGPKPQSSNSTGGMLSRVDNRKAREGSIKKRRTSSAKQEPESSSMSDDETFLASPCLVTLGPGVRISTVAAGGRHTLALSDMGQVWGWGYGGEGQLGLGSRTKLVSSPHLIPCFNPSAYGKDRPSLVHQGSLSSTEDISKVPGSRVKGIACGGRHSAVITDAGQLLTFGWGLHGQTLPKLLDASNLENKRVKIVSCGARHSVVLTEGGEIFSWGWNKYGQLGLGDCIDRNIPSPVSIGGCQLKNVACGWWHTLLLATTSTKLVKENRDEEQFC